GGAKLVLLIAGKLLTMLRDDTPDIPFPGHWDLPGGGREGPESPEDCILRELEEEFGLKLTQENLIWKKQSASVQRPGGFSYYFGANLSQELAGDIVFGDEGQEWRLVTPDWFISHPMAVPHFPAMVRVGLDAMGIEK
ncbi:MAG: NUDIX domain-containing protein, partial [Rhodobacteraceae bacterium]|nr:NUDIX domain-containing protein [Paracoccaceae bacterium]